MLPIALVNNVIPTPIVNTTMPGTVITHVPYDNVAPSISSAQVNNNASPNSEAAAVDDQPDATPAEVSAEEQAASTAANNAAQIQAPSAQAAFLAQLLSQDGSPATQTILVQYEKLAALSNVKYKPSDAGKPVPAPASVFGAILQQNKSPVSVQAPTPAQTVARQAESAPSVTGEEESAASSLASEAPAPRQPAPRSTTAYTSPANQTPIPHINAYTQTAARVTSQSLETTTELA